MNKKILIGVVLLICIAEFIVSYYIFFVMPAEKNKNRPPSIPTTNNAAAKDTVTVISREARIKDCKPQAGTIETVMNTSLSVENTDTVEHTIVIGGSYSYTLPAKTKQNVFIDFNNMVGDIAFTCDGKESGVIHVVEENAK